VGTPARRREFMTSTIFREATKEEISELAKIRGEDSQSENFWKDRILGYLDCTHSPQQALNTRIIYVACIDNVIVGFIAGHLTRRLECQGELQWIDVVQDFRREGIASELIKLLANWFVTKESYKVCVDPGNDIARNFYKKNGAKMLDNHWMFWEDIRTIL
jgi:GNAT superfamily N-acetyltransferase